MNAMTVESARVELAGAARNVWERFADLAVTALEDGPPEPDLAAEVLCEGITEAQGIAHALLVAATSAPVRPASILECAGQLIALRRVFAADIRLLRRPQLDASAHYRRDHDYRGWVDAIDTAFDYCEETLRRAESAQLSCWAELVEAAWPGSGPSGRFPTPATPDTYRTHMTEEGTDD